MMNVELQQCSSYPRTVEELQHIVRDADPIRMMELLMDLKDLGTSRGLLDDHDRSQLTYLHYLAAAMVRDMIPEKQSA